MCIFLQKVLGGKGSTIVYEGELENKKRAVKKVFRGHSDKIRQELSVLNTFKHENIVRYYGTLYDNQFAYICLEKADMNLQQLFESTDKCLIELRSNGMNIIKQLCTGLLFIHTKFIHLDIKPQNILISLKALDRLQVLYADFGNSILSNEIFTNQCCSFGWTAPERARIYGTSINETNTNMKKWDIFSLGLVFHFVLTDGRHPFGNEKCDQQRNINNDKSKIDQSLDLLICDLIKSMINHLPDLRPIIQQIMRHPSFWETRTKIEFLRDVSDFTQKNAITLEIEGKAPSIIGENFEYFFQSNVEVPCDRTVKNLLKSFSDNLSSIEKKARKFKYDEESNEYFNKFCKMFPELFLILYREMRNHRCDFTSYYPYVDD